MNWWFISYLIVVIFALGMIASKHGQLKKLKSYKLEYYCVTCNKKLKSYNQIKKHYHNFCEVKVTGILTMAGKPVLIDSKINGLQEDREQTISGIALNNAKAGELVSIKI